MPALLEGTTLKGGYHIEELIGRGGMAEVYKAWDLRRQHHVAIKLMREDLAEDMEFLRRFTREADALAALSHTNIVRFYSFEREGPLAFIVMDYVPGTTLRRRILEAGGAPLPPEEVLSVTRQVCAALHYAHAEGLLHRDIKPGNIMIQPDGQVLVADFGIAKATDTATVTAVMPGTPAYMSPEQCRSVALDVRTDVYSLGVVVYEMLANRRPFVGETTEVVTGSTREKIRWEQMHAHPPPLGPFNPTIPADAEAVLLKALAKERDERWPSILAFWQALEGALVPEAPPAQDAIAPAPARPRKTEPNLNLVQSPSRPVLVPEGGYEFTRPRLARLPSWAWLLGGLALAAVAILMIALASRGDGEPASADEPGLAANPVPTVMENSPALPVVVTASPTADAVSTEVARKQAVAATLTASAPTPCPTPTLSPSPTPTATPTNTPESTVSAHSGMVFVPAGEFTMGISGAQMDAMLRVCRAEPGECPTGMFDDERPAHTVYLDDYFIDLYEVTSADFLAFVDDTGYRTDAERQGRGRIDLGQTWEWVNGADWLHSRGQEMDIEERLHHPVLLVSWNDAVAYCTWTGSRLPTDAEWEKAARGVDGRIYPWGNSFACNSGNLDDETQIDSFTVGCSDGWMRTAPVGTFPAGASPFGVNDIAGNVREWVADWYDSGYYDESPPANPTGPLRGDTKSTRGGSWFTDRTWARVTDRRPFAPDYAINYIGFRCARDAN